MQPLRQRIEAAVAAASVELAQKTVDDIQIETAIKWCGRACAAQQLGLIADAHEYAHEAIEHGALADDPPLLATIRAALRRYGVEA